MEETTNSRTPMNLKWQQVKAAGGWRTKMQSHYGDFVFWQEIDGQALLLLTLPTVQECMDLKLGPAIKLAITLRGSNLLFTSSLLTKELPSWSGPLKHNHNSMLLSLQQGKPNEAELGLWQPERICQPWFFTLRKRRQHLEQNANANLGYSASCQLGNTIVSCSMVPFF